jgi:hypothetical protein
MTSNGRRILENSKLLGRKRPWNFQKEAALRCAMSRPTAETVTRSSKTNVIIYGNVGKHWVPSGMSHRVVWHFGRPASVSEENTTSIFRIASALNSEAEYYFETPVSAFKGPRFQDEWTPSCALNPSIWRALRSFETSRNTDPCRWGNVSCGLRYRVVLSCWWISELPASQWTQ